MEIFIHSFTLLIIVVYADGTGYNLKPVIDGDKSLEAITIQNLTFFYHPCGNTQSIPNLPNINDTDNACKVGYSLCMYDTAHNKTILLGQSGDMKFRRQHGDSMQVLFTKTSDNIVSSITLECTPKAKTSVLYAPLEKIDQVVSNILSVKFPFYEQIFFRIFRCSVLSLVRFKSKKFTIEAFSLHCSLFFSRFCLFIFSSEYLSTISLLGLVDMNWSQTTIFGVKFGGQWSSDLFTLRMAVVLSQLMIAMTLFKKLAQSTASKYLNIWQWANW